MDRLRLSPSFNATPCTSSPLEVKLYNLENALADMTGCIPAMTINTIIENMYHIRVWQSTLVIEAKNPGMSLQSVGSKVTFTH